VSGSKAAPKSLLTTLTQAFCLAVVGGLYYLVSHAEVAPEASGGVLGATGFLLVAGMLTSEVLELFKLPHLTGYLLAGAVAGPHVLHFFDHSTVKQLEIVNTLALSLIALAGGLELRVVDVRRVVRSVASNTVVQTGVIFFSQAGLFLGLAQFIPFARSMPMPMLVGVALMWGVIAVSRSPSATLAILSQTRAKGPLTRFSLAFVMTSDVVVVVLMALTMTLARPLLEPGAQVSLSNLKGVGHELLGSVSIGTTLGLLLVAYLRLVGRQVLLVLVTIGFVLSEGVRYLHFEPLLTFLTAGFVVQNLSDQGDKLLHAIEETSGVVFVVFFATAGAHLDLPLLATMWPIALSLCAGRFVMTWISHRLGTRWAGDPPLLRRWGWASLVSQAGLTLGLAVVIARNFPSFGESFRSLVVASVAINEVVGPILFKMALDRVGETGAGGLGQSLRPGPMETEHLHGDDTNEPDPFPAQHGPDTATETPTEPTPE
jgi:Kef-type K+ transport system membrane component KefB